MQTIAKNSKKAQAVLDAATNVRVYTLANHFVADTLVPEPMSPDAWRQGCVEHVSQAQFLKETLSFRPARLVENSAGSYTLHVTGNEWYRFEAQI